MIGSPHLHAEPAELVAAGASHMRAPLVLLDVDATVRTRPCNHGQSQNCGCSWDGRKILEHFDNFFWARVQSARFSLKGITPLCVALFALERLAALDSLGVCINLHSSCILAALDRAKAHIFWMYQCELEQKLLQLVKNSIACLSTSAYLLIPFPKLCHLDSLILTVNISAILGACEHRVLTLDLRLKLRFEPV